MNVLLHPVGGTLTHTLGGVSVDIQGKTGGRMAQIRLYGLDVIPAFNGSNGITMSEVLDCHQHTDSIYLQKRNIPKEYDPTGAFAFSEWKSSFMAARDVYEHLHEDLLYTDERQDFGAAVSVFEQIDAILADIQE